MIRPLPTIVLTAGLGTRLDPLTRLVAKPAVPVRGRTLVEHVLAWLRTQGITDVVLNLHHLPHTITGALGDGVHLGMRVRYSWERRILGSAGGPSRAAALVSGDPLLIVNGDTLCEIDLGPMLEFHERSGADATLAMVPNPAPQHYNGMVADADRRLLKIVPKGQAAPDTWHFVGVQIVNRRVFASLDHDVPAETTGGLYREMMASAPGSLRGWPVTARFVDVGTPRDYLRAALDTPIDAGSASHPPSGSSILWPDAHVASDAELDECIVASVNVPSGFRASRSVLVSASVVRPDEHVTRIGDIALFPL